MLGEVGSGQGWDRGRGAGAAGHCASKSLVGPATSLLGLLPAQGSPGKYLPPAHSHAEV